MTGESAVANATGVQVPADTQKVTQPRARVSDGSEIVHVDCRPDKK